MQKNLRTLTMAMKNKIKQINAAAESAAFSISAAKIFADTDESHSMLTMVRRDSGKVLIQLRVQGSHFVGCFHRVPVHK